MRALVLFLLVAGALVAGLFLLGTTGTEAEDATGASRREATAGRPHSAAATELAGVESGSDPERSLVARSDATTAGPAASREVATPEAADRSGRLRGRVTDGAGNPIEGADVLVRSGDAFWILGSDQEARTQPSGVTDAAGEFSLQCDAGERTVVVGADGFAPLEQTVDVPAGGATDVGDLRLAAGVTLRGRVVDSSGAGVPNADLRLTPKSTGTLTVTTFEGGEVVASTDDAGRFVIARQAVGPYRFAVAHANHPPATFAGTTSVANEVVDGLVVTLRTGASITGLVTGIDDGDRDGLVVRAAPAGPGVGLEVLDTGTSSARTAAVGPDGSFTVTGIEPGATVELELHAGPRRWNGSSRRSRSVTAKAGEDGVRLAFTRGASILFRVTDTGGNPVEPERVSVGASYARERELVPVDGVPGAYRIEGLWPGPSGEGVRFALSARGYEEHEAAGLALVPGAEFDLGTLVLRARPQVRVTVVSEVTGKPVEGASVVMRPAGDGSGVRSMSFRVERNGDDDEDAPMPTFQGDEVRGTTDEAGGCVLDALMGRDVVVEASHPRHAPRHSAPLRVEEGASEVAVDLALPAGGAIDVQVVDTTGQPAASYPIHVRPPAGEGGLHGADTRATSDELGRATLTGLAAGEQRLRLGKRRRGGMMVMPRIFGADSDAEDEYDWTTVTVVAGETVEATLVAPASGRIEGKLTELGVPLAGATVSIRDVGGASELDMMVLGGGPTPATVDARGEFALDDIEEGEHELVIEHPTRNMPSVWPLTVEAGKNEVEIDLIVTVVEGRVYGPDGKPLAGVKVEAKRHQPSSGQRVRAMVVLASDEGDGGMVMSIGGENAEAVRTDDEGRFTLRGVVAEAPIVVVAQAEELDEVRSQPFEVAPGGVRDGVELRFEVTGSVAVEVEGFQPGLMAVLRRRGEFSGEPKIEMLSGPRTTVEGLAPGAWTVSVRGTRPGESVSTDPDEVEVDVVGKETVTATFTLR